MRPAPPLPRLAAGVAVAVAVLLAGCDGSPTTPGTSPPASTVSSTTEQPIVHTTAVPALHPSVDDWPEATLEITTAAGRVHRLAVKVAATPDQRAHGLMEVPDVPDGTGMWFAYDEDHSGGFWMKNTLVPLDIAYVDADGRIVDIEHMVPCTADPCPTYPPDGPYRDTLEVPAGWYAAQDIAVGDRIVRVG